MPDKNTRLRHWLNVASRAIGDTGPVDWVLWIRGGRFVVERSTVPRSKQKPNSGTPRVA